MRFRRSMIGALASGGNAIGAQPSRIVTSSTVTTREEDLAFSKGLGAGFLDGFALPSGQHVMHDAPRSRRHIHDVKEAESRIATRLQVSDRQPVVVATSPP